MARPPAIEYVQRGAKTPFAPVVRALLDSVARGPTGRPPVLVEEFDWNDLWIALRRHRIETFLPAAIAAGTVVIPDLVVDEVRERARMAAVQQLKLVTTMREAMGLLDQAGIEARVLKGLATSELDYAEPSQRRTSDVDLLVRTDEFDRACEVVEKGGATELEQGHRPIQPVERTFRTADGIELDIHRRLFRFGPDGGDDLFGGPEPLPDGVGLALPAELRLVHAAAHLLVSPPGHRLCSSLFDVAVLSSSPKVDLAEALEQADVFGMRDIVRFAIWLADNVGVEIEELPPTVEGSLVNRAHLRPNRRVDLETIAVLADLEGVRDRLGHLVVQARRGPQDLVRRRVGQR